MPMLAKIGKAHKKRSQNHALSSFCRLVLGIIISSGSHERFDSLIAHRATYHKLNSFYRKLKDIMLIKCSCYFLQKSVSLMSLHMDVTIMISKKLNS